MFCCVPKYSDLSNCVLIPEISCLDIIDSVYFTGVCYICDEPLTQENYTVRDHIHLTVAYRGPAHNLCNLKTPKPNYIPVLMHNFSNYDAHLFIKEFGKVEGDLKVIPQTDDKYISITQKFKVGDTWRELRFLDSFRFT